MYIYLRYVAQLDSTTNYCNICIVYVRTHADTDMAETALYENLSNPEGLVNRKYIARYVIPSLNFCLPYLSVAHFAFSPIFGVRVYAVAAAAISKRSPNQEPIATTSAIKKDAKTTLKTTSNSEERYTHNGPLQYTLFYSYVCEYIVAFARVSPVRGLKLVVHHIDFVCRFGYRVSEPPESLWSCAITTKPSGVRYTRILVHAFMFTITCITLYLSIHPFISTYSAIAEEASNPLRKVDSKQCRINSFLKWEIYVACIVRVKDKDIYV